MNDLIQRIGFKEKIDAGFQKIDGYDAHRIE